MSNPIYLTKEEALLSAKVDAIRAFETDFKISVDDDLFINSDNVWLIKSASTHCNCGETEAVEVTLFPKYITNKEYDDPSSLYIDQSGFAQYTSKAGICDNCGKAY